MAKQTNIDVTALIGNASEAIDVSGYTNTLLISPSVEEVDVTTYDDLARRRIAGLEDLSFALNCLHDDGGQPWDTLNDVFATADTFVAWIESNASMAEQDRGAFARVLAAAFEGPGGQDVGSAQMVNVSGNGDMVPVFAQVLQEDGSLTVSGTSTGFQFGSLAAGETLYCVQFVLSVTAGSIVGTIESDDNSGFTSATTRATFTSATTATTELQTVAGAVTDDWWRYEYTIVTGPATVVTLIGKR